MVIRAAKKNLSKLRNFSLIAVLALASTSLASDRIVQGTSFSGQFLAANSALANRDFESAANYLHHLHLVNPTDAVISESLFVAHLINGEFELAEKFAKLSLNNVADKKERILNHEFLIKLFLNLESLKFKDFKSLDDNIVKGNDFMISELNFQLMSAWLQYELKDSEAAKKHISSLEANSFHKIYHLIHQALLAELENREKDADYFYTQALEFGGSKLDLIEAYGRFLERTGRLKQAFALYDDYENRAGKHPLIDKARARMADDIRPDSFVSNAQDAIAYNLYHIALIYYGNGNFDESINYARLSQYLRPNDKYVLNLLSLNYGRLGKYMAANKALVQIKEDSSFYKKAQVRIAKNYENLGDRKYALKLLEKNIAAGDAGDGAYAALADTLKRDEQYKKAIPLYSKLIDALTEPNIDDANLYFNRAVSYAQADNWDAAVLDFQKTIELDANHSSALNYLGYSWVDMGVNLDEGLEMINTALLIEPQNAFIVDSLGWAYFKLGEYEKAMLELQRALLINPSNADISDHLGDVYWKLGRKKEAEFKWQQATIFKSDEINYEDLEYKREHGLDALDKLKEERKKKAETKL